MTSQSTYCAAEQAHHRYPLAIVGAGAAGIAVAASLLSRQPDLKIVLIDPAQHHYYQPGFTMVGGGIFRLGQTQRDMKSLIPRGAHWLQTAVRSFEPEHSQLVLENGERLAYERLIVCPGLSLNWAGVEGLEETLGKNGVTSNYRADLAPYTWELVQTLKSGTAIFTQPPMPIKCAGAPQKALYLSADHWYRQGKIRQFDIRFYNAGVVLFGVPAYVPALQSYMDRYGASLHFNHRLVRVDGNARRATFLSTAGDGSTQEVETDFDMLHVCPPQHAPEFVRSSSLVDAAGWVEVDPKTLRHVRYRNIWALGDVSNTPNAKTAAAARKQAPIVAMNVLADIRQLDRICHYDGYGSCPLTVERGKIVLAEFGYDGKLLPSFPASILDGTKPGRLAWILKKDLLPPIYWQGMLKGREWLARPRAEVAHTHAAAGE